MRCYDSELRPPELTAANQHMLISKGDKIIASHERSTCRN